MYAQTITPSMQQTIDETNRRRSIQERYNREHHIVPKQIVKTIGNNELSARANASDRAEAAANKSVLYQTETAERFVAEAIAQYDAGQSLETQIEKIKKEMYAAAERLDFVTAAQLRDLLISLEDRQRRK